MAAFIRVIWFFAVSMGSREAICELRILSYMVIVFYWLRQKLFDLGDICDSPLLTWWNNRFLCKVVSNFKCTLFVNDVTPYQIWRESDVEKLRRKTLVLFPIGHLFSGTPNKARFWTSHEFIDQKTNQYPISGTNFDTKKNNLNKNYLIIQFSLGAKFAANKIKNRFQGNSSKFHREPF